jgi:hypothetical protein
MSDAATVRRITASDGVLFISRLSGNSACNRVNCVSR